jgi:serine/threonine protein kinase
MIGQTFGHYRILEKIGEGGMGVVFRAHDERLDRDVAVKLLPTGTIADDEKRKRFRREARTLSQLSHPNIETVHDLDSQEGVDFLVMEFIPGETLDQKLSLHGKERAGTPLHEHEIVRLGIQLADGLAAAHEHGVVHRDLKPNNLRITPDGRLKILDFGVALLAKPFSETARTDSDVGDQGISGTLPYMSPEQLRGEKCDARGDLYSAGIVLLQMATAKPPGVWDPSLRERICPELQRIIRKLIERDPENRHQSARELLAELRQLEAGVRSAYSVAVLYFENLGGDPNDEYLRDGITEDIITELCKVRPLRVFPRSAVLTYRDKPVAAQEVGRVLEAAYVLGGSIRRTANRLRITTQLVNSRTGHSIWAERYDRELRDVLDLQGEIARSISQALRITLSPQEEEAIASKPTENAIAYDCYLRGRSLSRRCTHTDLDAAILHYERSIAYDPNFALAFAGLGIACGLIYEWHDKDPGWIERARAAADRALALEPDLAEALAARARLAWAQKDYPEAAEFARRAIERKPNCEHAYWTLGQAYFNLDRLADLAALAEQTFEFSGADYNVYVPLYLCFERLGDREASRRVRKKQTRALEQHLQQVPEDVRARILIAGNYASFGDEAVAMRHVQTAVALRPNDSNVLYNAACSCAILHRKKEALEFLRKARQAGFVGFEWAARDTDLASLHDDPEFVQFMESATSKV